MAMNTGKKAKGVHDIKLRTAKVPVEVNGGAKYFTTIKKPCSKPAAARMYTIGAKMADIER